ICAWRRSRGVSLATRYHEALRSERVTAPAALRQPLPERETHPVDHLVCPDPDHQAAIDLDLPHALHPGTQAFGRALKPRLDPEVVSTFSRRRDRRHLLDGEGQRLRRGRGEQQLSVLSDGHSRDVALVDLENNAVRLEWR